MITALILSLLLSQSPSVRTRPPVWILQARTAWRTSEQSELRAVFRNDSRSKSIEKVSGALILLDGTTHEVSSYPVMVTYEFGKPLAPGKSAEGIAPLEKAMPEMGCSKLRYEPLPGYVDRGKFAGVICSKDVFTLYVEEVRYSDKTTWKPTRKDKE